PPRSNNICPLRGDIRKIGTIQRRLAWPLHKDDTLSRSGRPTGLNIYFAFYPEELTSSFHRISEKNTLGSKTYLSQRN
ncbi:hypothetical protein M405DRAFT_180774, partial [Rhizopogon salebrosus TDB-379]